jgi:uncharacterized protein GlcG (DUF336 family)
VTNWVAAIREFFGTRRDCEERPVSSERRFRNSQVLESRLVLGSLSADATLITSAANSQPASAVPEGQFGSGTDDSSAQGQSNPLPLNQSTSTLYRSQLANDALTTNSMTDSHLFDVISASHPSTGILGLDTAIAAEQKFDSAVAVENWSSTAPPLVTSSELHSTSQSVISSNALESPRSPLEQISPRTDSPSVAIDNALTAVNRNVMVSSAFLNGLGSGSANATAAASTSNIILPEWFTHPAAGSTIRYDFRDQNGVANQITSDQIAATEHVLQTWSDASGGTVNFVRDTEAANDDIINIGVGDLSALSSTVDVATTLGTSRHSIISENGTETSVGTIWLNSNRTWTDPSSTIASGSSVDFQTVMAHETGHMLGLEDDPTQPGIMNPVYAGIQNLSAIATAWDNPTFSLARREDSNGFITENLLDPQLSSNEVTTLLKRAAVALPEENAIIAIVDRNGNILGVRVEQEVLDTIKDPAKLAFAIDGAVSEARTAAFFSNDATAVTSRTIETLSATTILQREVEANPNDPNPTIQGPGFVAAIGIGGHFPAGIENTPPVDLFNIEASNRDSTPPAAGFDRFNVPLLPDPANPGNYLPATMTTPISYGTAAGIAGDSQNRGIGTLPGGIPIYRDPNQNGVGATLVGGIGVFFPGDDGYATHEQGFIPGQGQTEFQRMNTTQELEAEFIALAAVGGSPEAARAGVNNAVVGNLAGIAPVANVDVLFENITLKGILLPVAGSTAGKRGIQDLINQFITQAGTGADSGLDQPVQGGALSIAGKAVPDGWLVTPRLSPDNSSTITIADMNQIINAGIDAAMRTRATLRVQPNDFTGQQNVAMTFAISDRSGNVLALYRMPDSTVFSQDVAVAKSRNVAYYNDPSQLNPIDQVFTAAGQSQVVSAGTSFTSRTFRFLAEPRYPAGVDDSEPPQFSILTDAATAGIDPATGENIGGPASSSAFTSVMGNDVFHVGTNFHDTPSPNQNGIIFFPGSTALYKDGKIEGGLGVSGDGVNQDDVVTYLAAQGYLPDTTATPNAPPADYVFVNDVRLPYFNFTRNPFG